MPTLSTSRAGFPSRLSAYVLLLLLVPMLILPFNVTAAGFDEAVDFYKNGNYSRAADILEKTVSGAPSSEAYHWLGKSYGHMAEQASPLRALELARKTRLALEKAVQLDNKNREATEDLMEFYQQAPALVGGNPERAASLRQRLMAMDRDIHNPDNGNWAESNSDS